MRFRRKGQLIDVRVSVNEAGVLRRLARDVDALLATGPAAGTAAASADSSDLPPVDGPEDPLHAVVGLPPGPGPERPTDPVLARLLPDAYGEEDAEAASDFRRYTEAELRGTKRAAVAVLVDGLPDGGGEVRLDEEQAEAWLAAINDIRLALGAHLEIDDDWHTELERLDPWDPRARRLLILENLTHWQGNLLVAITGYRD